MQSNIPQHFLLAYIQGFSSLLCCHSVIRNDIEQRSLAVLWGSSCSSRSLEHNLKCDGRPLRRCNLKGDRQRNSTQTAHLLVKLYFQEALHLPETSIRVVELSYILLKEQERGLKKTEPTISPVLLYFEPSTKWHITKRQEPVFKFGSHSQLSTHNTWTACSLLLPARQDGVCYWRLSKWTDVGKLLQGPCTKVNAAHKTQWQWNCVAKAAW